MAAAGAAVYEAPFYVKGRIAKAASRSGLGVTIDHVVFRPDALILEGTKVVLVGFEGAERRDPDVGLVDQVLGAVTQDPAEAAIQRPRQPGSVAPIEDVEPVGLKVRAAAVERLYPTLHTRHRPAPTVRRGGGGQRRTLWKSRASLFASPANASARARLDLSPAHACATTRLGRP